MIVKSELGKLLLAATKIGFDKQTIKSWFRDRRIALDYFHADTEDYTKEFIEVDNTPTAIINITKRIIDRISLVYLYEPIRMIDEKNAADLYKKYWRGLDPKMQRSEKITNLLDAVLNMRVWRDGKIETDLIWQYELLFSKFNPMEPIAFTYPISSRAQPNADAEVWVYWDKDHTYKYERGTIGDDSGIVTKILPDEKNPEHVNPYGLLPGWISFRDGVPERSFLAVDVTRDIIQTNLAMNVIETAKYGNCILQSFGREYYFGTRIDLDAVKTGPGHSGVLPVDARVEMVSPPDTVESIETALNGMQKRLSLSYHLPGDFFEGTTAESGTAKAIRCQELQDDRISDIARKREDENKAFQIDKAILKANKIEIGSVFSIDFRETENILTPDEKRAQDEHDMKLFIKDEVDIFMERDPDKFKNRAAAIAYMEIRGYRDPAKATPADRFAAALNDSDANA
jgi:hypothetical protein